VYASSGMLHVFVQIAIVHYRLVCLYMTFYLWVFAPATSMLL